MLIPAVASAQETYSPYWDETPTDAVGDALPTWITQVRLGPYRPSIDASFASNPGPYARTFLKDSLLFEIDVHRVWSVARGQLGVGFSAGYFTNSALAWQDGTSPGQPDRPRASGNLTRVSMVPTAVTAIYRATILDDELGLPLVPYVRGGLAYNVWWMKNPADELSVAMSCPTCEDRAIGGTIGVVAAVGLAIRAERIDPTAATSMHNTGIEHAGFFAEIEAGWIDGFGKKSKLSVGDTTWFGGITFEF
ncbi:MAG: MXAN_2562 family outer membrane beta-barrel protein [Kofleriaceae bacterium]